LSNIIVLQATENLQKPERILSDGGRQSKTPAADFVEFIHVLILFKNVKKGRRMAKLFVGNIPHSSTDMELQEWVQSQGFDVESAQIIRDRSTGQSRGFGFIVLNDGQRLKEAISALNGQRMGGRVLTVNEALPQPSRGDGDARNSYRR
jgi:RNA recognition motif-containing protein